MSDPSPSPGPLPLPLPLRSALKTEDDSDKTPPVSGSLKAVQIAEPVPESYIEDDTPGIKPRRTTSNRRVGVRPQPSPHMGVSSRSSGTESSPLLRPVDDPSHYHARRQYYGEKLLAQVGEWLDRQQKKTANKKKATRSRKGNSPPAEESTADQPATSRERSNSIDSDSSEVSLDRLQVIIEGSMASMGLTALPSHSPRVGPRHRRITSRSSLHRTASSDTDYVDGDAIVPSCDAILDNSKTLSYTGGGSSSTDEPATKAGKDKDAWPTFKNDILRIAHTLRLKGWRRVPLGSGDSITVERLSGALTNAVYVVTPPSDMSQHEGKKMPSKILLRVYGPQVEHLIDRENELQVLQRLARKKIGPRLLGTFKNGRFEEFFNAITLTPSDIRDPDTSRQIAKRMRELHDGIELLPQERENGPGVWKNWDQWLDNVGRITTFLDEHLDKGSKIDQPNSKSPAWKANGYVCGVPWTQFRDTVIKYRAYLNKRYGGEKTINAQLTFAHNDTQYGNILRIRPDDEKSPLLQPANKHKQLIVIDFEYAGANTVGLEFANHFTEWTYNYHDPVTSYACNSDRYPTIEEQRRFIKAYVDHRSQFPNASSTPRLGPVDGGVGATPSLVPSASSSSIVDFMLDARYPGGDWSAAERAREERCEKQISELLEETRLWRPANSAMWVAWGIVQAKVPGLDGTPEEVDGEDSADEFDYLQYAQERALFFWGDCVQLGLIKLGDLPESLQQKLKKLDY